LYFFFTFCFVPYPSWTGVLALKIGWGFWSEPFGGVHFLCSCSISFAGIICTKGVASSKARPEAIQKFHLPSS
jgi:hypothetical protein